MQLLEQLINNKKKSKCSIFDYLFIYFCLVGVGVGAGAGAGAGGEYHVKDKKEIHTKII